jgi:hypothetical protein
MNRLSFGLIRRILLTADRRCAVPDCGKAPVRPVAIEPPVEGRECTDADFVALCGDCAMRYANGALEPTLVKAFRKGLDVMQRRYTYPERDLLRRFAQNPGTSKIWMPDGMELTVRNLILVGIIRDTGERNSLPTAPASSQSLFELTENGQRLIDARRSGDQLDSFWS